MNFSIATIMRRLLAPQHELSCSRKVWRELIATLRKRGKGRSRESGAFLLGHRDGVRARIVGFVPYDALDPHCLDTGIVRFDGRFFGSLWELCKRLGVTVVADVHTHPGSSDQSISDQNHPMISRSGHIALILPRFAAEPLLLHDIGMYVYQGAKNWRVVPRGRRRAFLHIGF